MRADLAAVRAEIAPLRAHLDGLPFITRSVTVLQQDTRALKAAFNDFALTNPTKGEIEALHTDVNRVQAETRSSRPNLATVERLLSELTNGR